MKKYKVGGLFVSAAIIAGEEPWDNGQWDDPYGDYVEAETPEEAVEQVMDWLVEEASGEAEINEAGDMVIYRDEDGEITSGIALFEATEIEN